MVTVNEVSDIFWGVTLNEGKRYTQTIQKGVHVSMAALEPSSNKGAVEPVSVMIQHDNSDFMLCSLSSSHVFQQALDLNFNEGEEVTFYLKGKGTVHLTGYVFSGGDDYDSEDDEDFQPASSFLESDEEETSDEETGVLGSKKRKKPLADKKSKKPRVEIVDDEDEDDEDDSDMEADDDDDDEEEVTPKQTKKKQQEPKPSEKKEKNQDGQNSAKNAPVSKETQQSTPSETGEKKKKKKKKNKNKKAESSENATQQAAPSPSSGKETVSKASAQKVIEGVVINDLKVGHGPDAKKGSTVHVYYSGKLPNGKMFDSKISGKPFKFQLGKKSVIKGWEVGVEGMKVGGKRKLVIPPKMAYGSTSVGDIPANSTLHFEVELKAVN